MIPCVSAATEDQVRNAEPYVLFYQRMPQTDDLSPIREEERRKLKMSYKFYQRKFMEIIAGSGGGRGGGGGSLLGDLYGNPGPVLSR